jgi:hypothetical protein
MGHRVGFAVFAVLADRCFAVHNWGVAATKLPGTLDYLQQMERAVRRPSYARKAAEDGETSGKKPYYSPDACALGAMLGSATWYPVAVAHLTQLFFEAGGNARESARRLRVPWRTLRNWCCIYPELQRNLDSAREAKQEHLERLRIAATDE